MTIEEKAFSRRRFVPEAMLSYGFCKTDAGYVYTTDFLNGDFSAAVMVTEDGTATGSVVDNMNGELYAPLRAERFNGAYVNAVRAAYEDVLQRIATHCCREVTFDSEQANRITEQILDRYGVRPDFPWGKSPHEHSGVFRHADSGKWFALIMHIRKGLLTKDGDAAMIDAVNLKRNPEEDRPTRAGVYPAYHMNHKSWITVTLDETLSDDAVMDLISDSFSMTRSK